MVLTLYTEHVLKIFVISYELVNSGLATGSSHFLCLLFKCNMLEISFFPLFRDAAFAFTRFRRLWC